MTDESLQEGHFSRARKTGMPVPGALLAWSLRDWPVNRPPSMECLGQMIGNSQRAGLPPDGAAYVECVRRR